MTKLCYVIDKFVVNVACGIAASDALRCTGAHVILSLAKYLMNNKAKILTKYKKEHKFLKSHQQHGKSANIKVVLNIRHRIMFHACKFLKSHQLHEERANIKVILNIIFIIMLMVQGIPVGVFNHLLNNKTET